MAKATKKSVLNRLAGKKVCFNGKFGWSEEERLSGMAKAQQAQIAKELDASVDYLVLADMSAGKTIQKKALSLNAKGANIQVIDAGVFDAMAKPTEGDVLALIRSGGKENAETLGQAIGINRGFSMQGTSAPFITLTAEKFDGLDLSGFSFDQVAFNQCSFVGATIEETRFDHAADCDFRKCKGASPIFGDVASSKFGDADLTKPGFEGDFAGADFTGARLEEAQFSIEDVYISRSKKPATSGCVFTRANLSRAKFYAAAFKSADFDQADLSGAMVDGSIEASTFRKAKLVNASLLNSKFAGADFSGANLSGANFAGADLTDAKFDGADLTNCNLRGAALKDADPAKGKNYDPNKTFGGSLGPSLKELDSITKKAKRINITLRLASDEDAEGDAVAIDSASLKYGWFHLPSSLSLGHGYSRKSRTTLTPSDALLQLANVAANRKVRYETVEVQSTKSPTGGKELREIVLNGIAEAFAQALPAAEDLAAATAAYRDKEREKTSAERAQREKEKKKAEKKKEAEKKQIATKIEKEVGKVTDIATFLKALELRADKQKIDKATKMLKASGFQLFNDVTDAYMNGVVKSQTDPDLVYACRLESTGAYACCTQNLNICGGLRGSICKHLLVLIIGLVKAGELDPTTIDAWVAKSHENKPELNKETMGDIFIRYKGAEAGEVDWRPTETVPEDYYAL